MIEALRGFSAPLPVRLLQAAVEQGLPNSRILHRKYDVQRYFSRLKLRGGCQETRAHVQGFNEVCVWHLQPGSSELRELLALAGKVSPSSAECIRKNGVQVWVPRIAKGVAELGVPEYDWGLRPFRNSGMYMKEDIPAGLAKAVTTRNCKGDHIVLFLEVTSQSPMTLKFRTGNTQRRTQERTKTSQKHKQTQGRTKAPQKRKQTQQKHAGKAHRMNNRPQQRRVATADAASNAQKQQSFSESEKEQQKHEDEAQATKQRDDARVRAAVDEFLSFERSESKEW
jgi:hypothetical protein